VPASAAADVVVIGAGIAGLTAAWEVARLGRTPVLLEQDPRPGGLILTECVDGFVIDAGPDSLLVQKPAAVTLCRELGLGERLQPTLTPRTAFVVRRGELVPLPEASVLGIPTAVGPFVKTRLFSLPAKAGMALEVLRPRRAEVGDESIGSFMRRRFGREAVEYLADPLLAGIHAGDVERLSMHALFPRLIEAERTFGSVLRALRATRGPSSPDGAFVSLPGGIGELVEALVSRLPPGTLRCGARVIGVDGRGPFSVALASGAALEARAVIVATPGYSAADMLEGVDARLASRYREVPYVSTATVVFGLRQEQVRRTLAGSGFLIPRPERRALMAVTWVSSKWPGRAPEGSVLLRAFVGGAYDQAFLERTDQEIADVAFAELAARLEIAGRPGLTRLYRWPRANAQHEVGHLARVADMDARLTKLPGLFVTGSGFRGTGIPDCIADARKTASRAVAFLSESEAPRRG
jgi:oxygen-dependent protoporphyrinogen oxidase